jgi:hypothetical protein
LNFSKTNRNRAEETAMRIADFNAKQKDGWTAKMFAGYYKHLDTFVSSN